MIHLWTEFLTCVHQRAYSLFIQVEVISSYRVPLQTVFSKVEILNPQLEQIPLDSHFPWTWTHEWSMKPLLSFNSTSHLSKKGVFTICHTVLRYSLWIPAEFLVIRVVPKAQFDDVLVLRASRESNAWPLDWRSQQNQL